MSLPLSRSPSWQRAIVASAAALCSLSVAYALGGSLSVATALPWLLIVLGGVVSGFLAGLLGIGGALVTIPTYYAVLPMLGTQTADLPGAVVASALLTMVPTALSAAWRQRRHGALDATWLRRLSPPMVVGAVAGAVLASQVHGSWLAFAFVAQSLYYGTRMVADRRDDGGASPRGLTSHLCRAPVWLIGAGMAAFCGSVGMGSGTIVTPFLRHRGLVLRNAAATASALNLWIAFGGSAGFVVAAASGHGVGGIHLPAAFAVGIVAVLAAPLGVSVAHAQPATRLRILIGAVNVIAAVTLAVQLFLAG